MRRIGQVFNRANRNPQVDEPNQNQPGVRPPRANQGANRAGGILNMGAARFLNRNNRVNFEQVAHLSLNQLRVDHEPEHQLVTIPNTRNAREVLATLRPPRHEATDQLTGRDYIQALDNDHSLGVFFREWVRGRRILGNNLMNTQRLNVVVHQLRMIVGAMRSNPELIEHIDTIAEQADTHCVDRSNYYLSQMLGHATLELLRQNGGLNPNELFNLGVSYYRLALVQEQAVAIYGVAHDNSVHTTLAAEIALQGDLDLPTFHPRENFPETGLLTQNGINTIRRNVTNTLSRDEGRGVWRFLANWSPWRNYVSSLEGISADREQLENNAHETLERYERERQIEGSRVSLMDEEMYNYQLARPMQHLNEWTTERVGQYTWEFLATERATQLIEQGQMPAAFQRR